MAKLTSDDLLAQFKEMTLVELSDFVKAFETEFDVTAAAQLQLQQQAEQPAAQQQQVIKMSSHLSLKMLVHRRLQLSRKFVTSTQAWA